MSASNNHKQLGSLVDPRSIRNSLWKFVKRLTAVFCLLISASFASADHPHPMTVPDGFQVELAATAPLVQHPMMGCFDDQGRLFLAESAGRNLNEVQLDEIRPNSIRMLEDVDHDGVFDRSTVFADQLAIPNGVLWLDGSLYVSEPPGIWRLTDTDSDGVADVREHIAGNVRSNGMSSTLHGPILHPSGRIFWCGGQQGYHLDCEGEIPEGRMAPGIFSLKPDGTEHELVAVGGHANPVEVDFGPTGDIFGTVAVYNFVDGARHDSLMHWIYGGLYSNRDPVPDAIHTTGPQLPPLSHVGQVAPAGMTRYRSSAFGDAFRDNLFWTQFNTRTLIRTSLQPKGATFTATDENFLVCEHVDFHPTDVIEDADGSLLVIDTGGWFRHGCPTSRIARPESLGAIYRVRHRDAAAVTDPRGSQVNWNAPTDELIPRLSDARPAVAERAMSTISKRGDEAVKHLVVSTTLDPQASISRLWTLCRIETEASLDAIVGALDHRSAQVRKVAALALGMTRHENAADALLEVVSGDERLPVRREAAAALGRIGHVDDISPLIAALSQSPDPFYQHSVIDALVRIGKSQPIIDALANDSAAVRRGAILALSNFDGMKIRSEQLMPMLLDHDIAIREAALEVALNDPDLLGLFAEAIPSLLSDDSLIQQANQSDSILTSLLRCETDPTVQAAIATAFTSDETSLQGKRMILDVMRRTEIRQFPKVWIPAIKAALTGTDSSLQAAALGVIAESRLPEFDALLTETASDSQRPDKLRMGCLETVAPRLRKVPDALLAWAISQLDPDQDSIERIAAARTIATLQLNHEQLKQVGDQVSKADAFIVSSLLNAFTRFRDETTGDLLVESINQRNDFDSLPAEQLAGLIRRFPAQTQKNASSILAKIGVDLEQQQRRMEELMPLTEGGDVLRGKQVFFGKKASCSACHRVKGQGELIGPNLTTIASIREPRDLLESIVFPSASIVQHFNPLTVVTADGYIRSGLPVRRSDDELWLVGSDLKEIRIRTDDIDEISESSVSIMPQGLDKQLSAQELRDLIAFLMDLKPNRAYATTNN
tara:strand:- start:44765 stop:47935 length:3171 start_codon:yes stop_codon:yes gene_type:complete